MTAAPALFDFALLEENWGSPEDTLFQRILGLFRLESARLCAEIGAALQTGDRVRLRATAHTLKGAAGNVCAQSLAEAASALDDSALTAALATLEAQFAKLQQLANAVEAALAAGGPRHPVFPRAR
jgi:HPt (histidine-containing phosphotransfer) domain-containing protein